MLPFRFNAKTIIDEGRTTRESVDAIKYWLPLTSLPQIQDEFIVLFLLSCSNNIENTKKTIEAYFKITNEAPHNMYNDLKFESEEMVKLRKVVGLYVVPNQINNTVVISIRLLDTDYRKVDVISAVKYCCMSAFMSQIENPPSDAIAVIDLQGIGFMHLTCLKINVVATHLRLVQEGLPLKFREFHILNANYVCDRALRLFRMFIKNELFNSLKIHTSGMKWTEFHEKWIPACCLPEEYGGELESYHKLIEKTGKEIKKIQEFFDAEEELRKSYKLQ